MNDTPTCGMCPAFLYDEESVQLRLCFGCRQPPAQMLITEPPPPVINEQPMTEDEIRLLKERISVLESTLVRIEHWFGDFPPTGRVWQDGSPMSYGAAFGSNGEIDYMRSVAREALLGTKGNDE